MSVAETVARKVRRLPKGRAFSLDTFQGCGSHSAVRTSLSRLVRQGKLVNLARGVYARPKPNRFFGSSLPGPEEVAHTLARASGEQLAPHGAEVARRLGLSTQAPTQAAFYTTGRSRSLRVGNTHVHFQHAPAPLIRNATTPAGRALLALHHLGPHHTTTKTLTDLCKRVPAEDLLRQKHAPAWLRKRVKHLDADERTA